MIPAKPTACRVEGRRRSQARKGIPVTLVASMVLLISALCHTPAQAEWPRVVPSKDGTPISYEVFGRGRADPGIRARVELRQPILAGPDPGVFEKTPGGGPRSRGPRPFRPVPHNVFHALFRRGCAGRHRGDGESARDSGRSLHGRIRDCRGGPADARPRCGVDRCGHAGRHRVPHDPRGTPRDDRPP